MLMKSARFAALCLLMMVSPTVPVFAQKGAGKGAPAAVAVPLSFDALLQAGQREKTAGHLPKAEELMKQALTMGEAKKDPSSIIVATNGLAGVYRWQGKLKEALAMYEKVAKMMVEAKQDNTPGMATVLDNQATVLDDMNDFERAANVRKDAIKLYEAAGPSRDLAMVYANQASNFHALKRPEEAESAAQKAVAMYEQVGLKDSPDMAVALDTLGGIYKGQKKYDQAEKVQRQALAMLEKAYGPASPDVAITLSNLAHTDSYLNKWDEAKKLMQRSVSICKQVYGPTHARTKDAEKQLEILTANAPAAPPTK
jgi:tetratricopeptide (TPR) repeat protein